MVFGSMDSWSWRVDAVYAKKADGASLIPSPSFPTKRDA